MTEKLYYTDAFCKEFDARVLAVRAADGHFEILLDRTAFFPEGGGQFGDSGRLGTVTVLDTKEKSGESQSLTALLYNKTKINQCFYIYFLQYSLWFSARISLPYGAF